ncbi:MAG: GNAT family N-acetyltransferase [Thermoleophilia bacterium]|nr:GNAT family N-acetyltransferase [Thermoleophilia bacterium]
MEPLLLLREEVFCAEQGVPLDEERDAHDATALHLVAFAGGDLVGTCRLLAGDGLWKLGRMAVRRSARGTGVGLALLAEAERQALARGARRLGFTAQTQAIGFYRRGGYRTLGGIFDDAGIPHVWMERPLAE